MRDDERSGQDSSRTDEQPEDIEVSTDEADEVVGGKTPPPSGPVPIPYPN